MNVVGGAIDRGGGTDSVGDREPLVGEHLASMIVRHGIAEQVFEVATGQPHRWSFQDFSPPERCSAS